VLIVDDNPSIHEDFRKILVNPHDRESSLRDKATVLFGTAQAAEQPTSFEITSAFQGDEALDLIAAARRDERPFAVTFVDTRIPPGMDGIETIERACSVDRDLQFVLCSAYTDYTTRDILARLGVSDRLMLLRKPCDMAEILLIATVLCHKWNLAHLLRAQLTTLHTSTCAIR
jgi:CheY-like chemotaxis protein